VTGESVVRSEADADADAEMVRLTVALRADGEMARLVEPALIGAGYAVEWFEQAEGLNRFQEHPPAAFVLEFGVRYADTVSLCRTIRTHPVFAKVAIVLLATEADEADRVLGLEAGADTYLAMPFAGRELIAQVKAVLRSYARRVERERLQVADIEVDIAAMVARVGGRQVSLSITEFRLLEFLCRNAGRAVSREHLVQVISKSPHAGRRAVDVYVRRLRQKIEMEPSQPQYLKTVRGVGYRLSGERKSK
jgi:DNA-binding response OmpR family regulator